MTYTTLTFAAPKNYRRQVPDENWRSEEASRYASGLDNRVSERFAKCKTRSVREGWMSVICDPARTILKPRCHGHIIYAKLYTSVTWQERTVAKRGKTLKWWEIIRSWEMEKDVLEWDWAPLFYKRVHAHHQESSWSKRLTIRLL